MTEEVRTCSKCSLDQPLSMFVVTNWRTGTRRKWCRTCETARTKRYYAESEQYRQESKARAAAWAKANPEKRAASVRRGNLKRTYGLTEEQFAALLQAQDGACALCKTTHHGRASLADGSWMVDHSHKAGGHVRGLLCHPCNVALGHYERLIDAVGQEALAAYLTRPCPVPAPVRALTAHPPMRHKWVKCSVDGCPDHAHARGLCTRHYMRQKRTGVVGGAGSLYPVQDARRQVPHEPAPEASAPPVV